MDGYFGPWVWSREPSLRIARWILITDIILRLDDHLKQRKWICSRRRPSPRNSANAETGVEAESWIPPGRILQFWFRFQSASQTGKSRDKNCLCGERKQLLRAKLQSSSASGWVAEHQGWSGERWEREDDLQHWDGGRPDACCWEFAAWGLWTTARVGFQRNLWRTSCWWHNQESSFET